MYQKQYCRPQARLSSSLLVGVRCRHCRWEPLGSCVAVQTASGVDRKHAVSRPSTLRASTQTCKITLGDWQLSFWDNLGPCEAAPTQHMDMAVDAFFLVNAHALACLPARTRFPKQMQTKQGTDNPKSPFAHARVHSTIPILYPFLKISVSILAFPPSSQLTKLVNYEMTKQINPWSLYVLARETREPRFFDT